jgi:hypothetical protein
MSYFGIPVRNGLPIGLGTVAPLGTNTSSPFSPASFFANGEQGWWYDPSNFATLFQDSAGTTPVTAVEQPVGLQLDLSQGGVPGPELFSSFTSTGTWTVSGTTYSITSAAAQTDLRVDYTGTTGKRYVISFTASGVSGTVNFYPLNLNPPGVVNGTNITRQVSDAGFFIIRAATGASATISNISVKELPGNHRFQTAPANRPKLAALVNLLVGTATLATQSVTTRAAAHTLTFTGAGSITLSGTATGTFNAGTHSVTTTAGSLTATVSGTVTQADLRETNVGVGLPAYQAVVTSTNYDSVGFPVYIKPNGSNQFMQTNSINFTATDKMTLWQGVRKLSDAASAIACELSADRNTNNGSWTLVTPAGGGTSYAFATKGTTEQFASTTAGQIPAPITNVLTGIGDISGDLAILRVNGVQVAQSTADQGTGNYGNYPAYFYMRAGLTLPFGGNDYGSIARGAASTAAQITNGETYINSKTKAYT